MVNHESGINHGESKEFDPGENRVEAEINHVVHDAEQKDWTEVLSGVRSEIQRELHDAQEANSLDAKQMNKYWHELDGVEKKVNDGMDDSPEKELILKSIATLKSKLEIS